MIMMPDPMSDTFGTLVVAVLGITLAIAFGRRWACEVFFSARRWYWRGRITEDMPMPWCDWCACYHHVTADCITKNGRRRCDR